MRSSIIRPIQAQAGFTLVELLIVVIIIAILAAIVVPQFSSATKDAQEAALDSNLSAMRSAIELYRVQHNSVYPGFNISSGGTGCTSPGAVGTGTTASSAQAFTDQLLQSSNASGATCTLSDTTIYKFGPYFRKGIPADPISQPPNAAILIQSTGVPIVVASTTTTGGWVYDTKSGQIVMNNGTNDSKGQPYSTH